jgi:cyclophilin family peptidyl-prolyl cis-trans isomerase
MRQALRLGAIAGLWSAVLVGVATRTPAGTPSLAEVIAASPASEWRMPDPDNTIYLDLASGRVVLELAPAMAPLHVANIKALVRAGYYDGLAVLRLQDNFVAQLGDPDDRRSLGAAGTTVIPEFTASMRATTPFTALPDRDGYAPQVGFSNSMAMARDPQRQEQWLIHCYGALGVARGNDPESGNGSSLYIVIGHAPRQLDRNLAVVGRVWWGMERLSALPRGPGAMGFYAEPGQRSGIERVRIAADVPAAERTPLRILRSDSRSFATLLEARRNRQDDFYRRPAGFLDVCNALIPVLNDP